MNTPIKNKVKFNNMVFPPKNRGYTLSIDLDENIYSKIEKMAKENNVTMEEIIFMMIIDNITNSVFDKSKCLNSTFHCQNCDNIPTKF